MSTTRSKRNCHLPTVYEKGPYEKHIFFRKYIRSKKHMFLKKYIYFFKKYICFLKKYVYFFKKHIFFRKAPSRTPYLPETEKSNI